MCGQFLQKKLMRATRGHMDENLIFICKEMWVEEDNKLLFKVKKKRQFC